MQKTAVLAAFCCTLTPARWSLRAPSVMPIPLGGIYQAGPHAGTHCGGLGIHSRRRCPAEVTGLLYEQVAGVVVAIGPFAAATCSFIPPHTFVYFLMSTGSARPHKGPLSVGLSRPSI